MSHTPHIFNYNLKISQNKFQVNANVRPVSKVVIVKSLAKEGDMESVAHIAAIVFTRNRKDAIQPMENASANLDTKVCRQSPKFSYLIKTSFFSHITNMATLVSLS